MKNPLVKPNAYDGSDTHIDTTNNLQLFGEADYLLVGRLFARELIAKKTQTVILTF